MKVKACCAPLVHGCGNNLRSQTVEGSHVDRLPDLKFATNRAIGQLASAKADQRKAQGSWGAAPTHIPVLAGFARPSQALRLQRAFWASHNSVPLDRGLPKVRQLSMAGGDAALGNFADP